METIPQECTTDENTRGLTWTVAYHAQNGDVYRRDGIRYYEMQEALMDLSREAYSKGTSAKTIVMY